MQELYKWWLTMMFICNNVTVGSEHVICNMHTFQSIYNKKSQKCKILRYYMTTFLCVHVMYIYVYLSKRKEQESES